MRAFHLGRAFRFPVSFATERSTATDSHGGHPSRRSRRRSTFENNNSTRSTRPASGRSQHEALTAAEVETPSENSAPSRAPIGATRGAVDPSSSSTVHPARSCRLREELRVTNLVEASHRSAVALGVIRDGSELWRERRSVFDPVDMITTPECVRHCCRTRTSRGRRHLAGSAVMNGTAGASLPMNVMASRGSKPATRSISRRATVLFVKTLPKPSNARSHSCEEAGSPATVTTTGAASVTNVRPDAGTVTPKLCTGIENIVVRRSPRYHRAHARQPAISLHIGFLSLHAREEMDTTTERNAPACEGTRPTTPPPRRNPPAGRRRRRARTADEDRRCDPAVDVRRGGLAPRRRPRTSATLGRDDARRIDRRVAGRSRVDSSTNASLDDAHTRT